MGLCLASQKLPNVIIFIFIQFIFQFPFDILTLFKVFLHYVYECSAYLYVYRAPLKVRRGHWIPGTGVTDDCEPPYGCWEWNLGPLQEQPVLLTAEH